MLFMFIDQNPTFQDLTLLKTDGYAYSAMRNETSKKKFQA